MPRGVPSLGKSVERDKLQEESDIPKAELLGVIPDSTVETIQKPQPTTSYNDGVDVTTLPPPWETDPRWSRDNTNARQFVDVPDEWELRWLNPRLIDQFGWRDWMPVMSSDPRVKVKVRALVTVGNNIQRGGPNGPILAFMPRHWVESRQRIKDERVKRLSQSAVERQESLRETLKRSTRGGVVVTGVTHPTHTMGEGVDMQKDV